MPRPTPKTETRGSQILKRTTTAARLLLHVVDGDSNNPYLKGIAGVSILLLETVESVKSNKSRCMSMLEQIHEILHAIVNICGDGGPLPPTVLQNLSQFFDTLQKVHAYVRSQVDLGLFRRVLRHNETTALLEDCNSGLQHATEEFGVQAGLNTFAAIADAKEDSEIRHRELMELLEQANSTRSTFSFYGSSQSASSLWLLPASPAIFHGRESEVEELLKLLLGPDPFRTAILGPGGIGKSSLALAILHHADVISRFASNRYFISLESSTSAADMFSAVAAFFGLEETPKLSRAIVRYLSKLGAPCVLVLDNLEDCWEAPVSRSDVEDFLSLLSEIPHLELMVTMRGAERPGKVKWSRPFLPPLDRLDDAAAQQTFLDIVDEVDSDELAALLALTDNLPLAITLLANIASFEGGESVLKRWANETTSLLSEGFDKQSNLDKSIIMSLKSPRMVANPLARECLSIMSLLPDGVSENALAQMNLPFSTHLAHSKSTLLRCSLIYATADGRLRTLAPIRQYVAEKLPPTSQSFDALCGYFYALASLFRIGLGYLAASADQRRVAAALHGSTAASQNHIAASQHHTAAPPHAVAASVLNIAAHCRGPGFTLPRDTAYKNQPWLVAITRNLRTQH